MKKTLLYIIWGCMAVLCIGLGTLETAELLIQIPLMVLAVMFFLPAGILLYDAFATGNRKGILRLRWISLASLALTAATLVAFMLTSAAGNAAAEVLYDILIVVSCPMICGYYWLISLFLWACLLSATFIKPNQK